MTFSFRAAARAAVFLAASASLAPAMAGSARDFLKDAIRGDNSEIMLGRLGEQRAATPAARNFGQTLAADHSRAKSEAVRVASRLHMRPPHGVDREAREERNRLLGLSGWAFDREFARYMVGDHHKDIAKFRKEADTHDGAAAALARRQLPTLHKHLDMALALNARFGRYSERQP
jgi:putative membrane protein